MTLDYKLAKEARLKFWEEYHSVIEKRDFLGKDALMLAPDKISLIASIYPNYSTELGKEFRKMIPLEYIYRGEKFPVLVSPSIVDLL